MPTSEKVLARFLTANLLVSPELERSIATVEHFLPGAKKAKFMAGVQILRDSIAIGQWVPRGAVKVQSATYQGLVKRLPERFKYDNSDIGTPQWHDYNALHQCFQYGQAYQGDTIIPPELLKVPEGVQRAWQHCCRGFKELSDLLSKQRPKPVITEIGLSPKVTKTLRGMNLDIDLSSIKVPPTVKIGEKPRLDKEGKPVWHHGKPVMEDIYKVMWTPGVKFNMSRFSDLPEHCEACGKRIPSNMYVPIEARCLKNGPVALLIGTDCARSIFGVKDQGFNRDYLGHG